MATWQKILGKPEKEGVIQQLPKKILTDKN
jgi:hypothetical protein